MDQTRRDELAREHLPLVNRMVATMTLRFQGAADADEIRSFAMLGLATAIERYDPSRGVPFGAYAQPRIRGAIYDGLAEASWFPRRMLRQVSYFRRADELLQQATETPPPRDTMETVHRLSDRLKELSAAYVTTYDSQTCQEPADDEPDADLVLERKRFSALLRACIGTLPENHQNLLHLYFYKGHGLTEIARQLGHHKSWATRIMGSALSKLRDAFANEPDVLL